MARSQCNTEGQRKREKINFKCFFATATLEEVPVETLLQEMTTEQTKKRTILH